MALKDWIKFRSGLASAAWEKKIGKGPFNRILVIYSMKKEDNDDWWYVSEGSKEKNGLMKDLNYFSRRALALKFAKLFMRSH